MDGDPGQQCAKWERGGRLELESLDAKDTQASQRNDLRYSLRRPGIDVEETWPLQAN